MGQESSELRHVAPNIDPALVNTPTHAAPMDSSDPDEIRGNIEQTRSSLSETIDVIQERLNPQHLVDEAKESIRGATIGRVEDMVDSARDSVQSAGNGLMDTVRDNPVPVALIGLGLGWIFLRGRNRPQQPRYDQSRTAPYYRTPGGFTGQDYGAYPAPYGRDYPRGYPQQAQAAPNGVSDKAGQLAGQAQDTMQQFGDQAQYQAQQARGWFEDNLRENPFAVGAVALALGALVGLAIPETPQENQLLGDTRDSLMDKAQGVAQDTMQKVQSVAQETTDAAKKAAQQSAQRQGLAGNTATTTPTTNGTAQPKSTTSRGQ